MVQQKETAVNPYVAPSSDLIDESDKWSAYGVIIAEKYWRCVLYGRVLVMCTFVFGKVALDAILSDWQAAILDGLIVRGALIICLVYLVLVFPIAKCCVYFQRRNQTVSRFVEKRTKELKKTLNRPLIFSALMMLNVLMCFLSDDLIKSVWDFYQSWPSVRTWSLVGIPVVMPIAYFVVREATHRAENCLEQISKRIGQSS